MAIHYIGDLQRTPGRRACGARNGQADTSAWHACDCADCKDTLIGLPVRWAGQGSTLGTIVERSADRVKITWPCQDRDGSDSDQLSLFELENSWERVHPWERAQ